MGFLRHRRRIRRAVNVNGAISDQEVRTECWNGALQLLVLAGPTLERLIIVSTHGFSEHRSSRREDEKALTAALKERERVERTWRAVAHTLASRAAQAGSQEGNWALGRLRSCYPLDEDVEKQLDSAFESAQLGYGPVEVNLAGVAFAQLIGAERARQMALSKLGGLSLDLALLNGSFRDAWNLGEERFLAEARDQQLRHG